MKTRLIALTVATLLAAACANKMQPAQEALNRADAAVGAVKADADKYVHDGYQALQTELTDLKDAFSKKDFDTVISKAPQVAAEAQKLGETAAAKKAETEKAEAAEWSTLSGSVGEQLTTVRKHVEALGKNRRAAKGVDLAAAKAELADASGLWDKAQASHSAGHDDEAVTSAKQAQDKLDNLGRTLKLPKAGAK